jgi:hypothetical protein
LQPVGAQQPPLPPADGAGPSVKKARPKLVKTGGKKEKARAGGYGSTKVRDSLTTLCYSYYNIAL